MGFDYEDKVGPQPIDHKDLKNYKVRVIVSGERKFKDYAFFAKTVLAYLAEYKMAKEDVVFVTGDNKTGPEAMIEKLCQEHGYAWAKFIPRWDEIDVEGAVVRTNPRTGRDYNVIAAYWRNEEMAEVGTHLLTFYDGVCSEASDMIERMNKRFALCRVVLIKLEE